jgi:hypothetical protein
MAAKEIFTSEGVKNFGRGVGYDIVEYIPPVKIGEISATKIREQMKNEGKL